MTREDAIEVLENGEWWEELTEWYMIVHPEHDKLHDAVDMAISALRQQERLGETNKSLTMDELRQMDGEPVWWWNKSAKPVCTICVWDRFMDEPMFANYDWKSEDTLQLTKYKRLKKCGYKPYRQKPEEDDHE